MLRFFDNVIKNHSVNGTRKLNFGDMALGDQAASVVSKIIKNNEKFSELDLSKNCLTTPGMMHISRVLES